MVGSTIERVRVGVVIGFGNGDGRRKEWWLSAEGDEKREAMVDKIIIEKNPQMPIRD